MAAKCAKFNLMCCEKQRKGEGKAVKCDFQGCFALAQGDYPEKALERFIAELK